MKDIFSKYKKLLILLVLFLLVGFGGSKIFGSQKKQVQYQTAKAEKGTITVVVTALGQVSEANSAIVDTQASGVVTKVYVENGQKVISGDKVAELELDLVGKQRSASALASYQSAQNSLQSAQTNYYSLQSDMFTNWDIFKKLAENSTYQNSDGTPNYVNRALPAFHIAEKDWLAAEGKYKNQQNIVAQAQTSLSSAWLSYQRTSSTIYAPISGTVTGLSLQIGSVLTSQSNTSGTATAQKIASIETDASPIIKVNLSQIDTPKVKIGNRATLTFDAFAGKTFTGKVVSIDTIGVVNSGVTTYPAAIKLDTEVPDISSNMTAQASIITQIKDNVLLIPSSALQTRNGDPSVRLEKNGNIQEVNVESGLASSTQTEIVSGLSEGDTVVTSIISTTGTGQRSSQTQSPFGSFGGGAGMRIVR